MQIAGRGGFYDLMSERQYVSGVKRRRLVSISPFRRPLGPNAEAPNCTVTLDNGDGTLTPLFEHPPLNARATIGIGPNTVVVGVITQVSLGASIEVQVEG